MHLPVKLGIQTFKEGQRGFAPFFFQPPEFMVLVTSSVLQFPSQAGPHVFDGEAWLPVS